MSLLLLLLAFFSAALAQVRQPDRFINSGANLALNQQLFDQFGAVLANITQTLSTADLNLYFPKVIDFTLDGNASDALRWDIEGLNMREITFDQSSTNIVLIEPSQKIKVFVSNLCFRLDFVSHFSMNPEFLPYEEWRNASLQVRNMSLTLNFKI